MNRPAGLPVAQDTDMVDEMCGSMVSRLMQLDENPLDLLKVALQGIQESPGLKVLGCSASNQDGRVSEMFKYKCQSITYTEIPSSLIMYPRP